MSSPKKIEASTPVTPEQVAAFRLARQHLAGDGRANVATICRDACGMQAQVHSAAVLALWARNHRLTRAQIDSALWQQRALVKTSVMRGTLHLLAAEDFPLYIAALRASRLRAMRGVMARSGVTASEGDAARDAAIAALAAGPATRRELQARVLSRIAFSKRARKWFDLSWWGVVRQAIVEGHVCYGPQRGAETLLVRTDQWLPRLREWSEREAQQEFLRRYLRAYGPATTRDFAYWSGFSVAEARPIWESLRDEWVEVACGAARGAMLASDCKRAQRSGLREPTVSLLPNFDAYLLGHADKNHLLDARHYKPVFRSAGWISPVVLVDGRAAGVWSQAIEGKRLVINVAPFAKLTKPTCGRVEEEAAHLGAFLELQPAARFAR